MWFAMVTTGAVGELTLAQARTLIVLAAHATQDWEAWPSQERIADQAKLTPRGVRKALAGLQRLGLVREVQAGGGRRRSTVWQLTEPQVERPKPVKTRNTGSGFRRHKPGTPVPKNPEHGFPRTRTKELDSSSGAARHSGAQKTARRGATAPASAADVLGALTDAGISDPTRTELAGMPHVTVGLINRIAERARERGKGPGAVVLDIRGAAEKAARDAERKRQRRQAERQVLADIEQQANQAATGEEREQGLAAMREALHGPKRFTV